MPRARVRAGAAAGQVAELRLGGEVGIDGRRAGRLGHQRGQPVIALRADHDVDRALPADDLGAFGLGHAARHGQGRRPPRRGTLALEQAKLAEFREHLFGGAFADVAGVEDHEVGVFHDSRLVEAGGRQGVRHAGGVIDVHLAAVALDEDFLTQARTVGRLTAGGGLVGCDDRYRS